TNYSQIIEFISLNFLNNSYYLKYAQEGESSIGIGLFVITAPYLLPGLLLYKRLSKNNKSFDLYMFLIIIYLIMRLIGYFGASSLNRIAYFFNTPAIWLIPYYYRELKRNKYLYWVPFVSIAGIMIYWYFTFIVGGGAGTMPYTSIF